MECNCRSLLHSVISRRSKLDMYLWILVIVIPASSSTGRSSIDTTKNFNIAQKDSNHEAYSTISDSGVFIQSLGRDLYLATAFLSESVTLQTIYTAQERSQSLVLEAKVGLAPSFELLEADMPSESFEKDIDSNTYPLVTRIPSIETAMLNKSDNGYRIPTLLIPKDELLALEDTNNATVTSTAYPLTDSRVNSTAEILLYSRENPTDTLILSTDTATEMYSPSDFISSSMPVIPPTGYSTIPNVLDNMKPMMRNVKSDASGLSPSQQSRSVLVNILTYDTSKSDAPTTGSTMNVGPSWTHSLTNTPVLSDHMLSNTGTVLLTNTSDQIFSARHPNETYISSEYTSWSPVDISPAPRFTSDFELNTEVSRLAQPFSDSTMYTSGDYSDTIPSAGYLPFSSPVFYTSLTTTPVFISDWRSTSLLPGPSNNQTASASQHPGGNIFGSTVILKAEASSATGVYYQPPVVDTKDWAVPVTAGLSVGLLVAVVVVVLVCFRAKHRHDDPGHTRDGDDTPAVHTIQEQWRTGHTTVLSVSELPQRYKQQRDTGVLKKPRSDRNPNVGQKHAIVNAGKFATKPSLATGVVTRREIFEMDNMSPPAKENAYTQQNTQSNREEYCSDNDDLIYDDPTCIHDSSDWRYGFSDRIQSSPISVNRLAMVSDNILYTFNKIPQTEFETAKTSNRIWQNEPKMNTRHILGNVHCISVTDSSASGVSYKHIVRHQQDPYEPAQPGYSSSNDGYVSDEYRSEDCWESWDDRKYAKGDRGTARISGIKDISSTNGEDNNSINAIGPNIRASASGRADRRPGMYKCISFDETRLGGTENTTPVFSKDKSPTRKISTISESAMTYLKVPQDGCTTMTSAAYETVNDLTEVGNPSGKSQFFIGSFSNKRNNLNRGQNAFEKYLETSRGHSIDNAKETAWKELAETVEEIHVGKPDDDSEKQQGKPQDDYIFPIVRKAKIKILEERRNKKLEFKNSDSGDNAITAADHLWRPKNASKSGIQNRESENTVNQTSSVPASSADLPSRRVSHPSKIPTIVLTKEEDEATADTGRQTNLLHQVAAKQPRVRRLARANNPFLIEVDSSAISEKVRRLSAPAMTSSSQPTSGTGSRDGIIRSASNDHLSRYDRDNRFNSRPSRRPWSSEFLDLIINSEGYSKDERFKKMIDDRYDALFNNKYLYPAVGSRSDDHSFQQDLSPRIWKLLTGTSHTPLPRDEHGSREIGDTEIKSRLSPILDIRTSGQFHPLSNETDRFSQERKPSRHYPELQLEIPSSNEAATDTVAAIKSGKHATPKTHERDHTKILPVRDSHSPRPNLTHGTDGIDSVTDGIDRGTDGIDSGSHGIDSVTDGIDSGSHGIDSVTDGIDSGSHGIDSVTDSIGSGSDGIDRGTDGIDRGTDGIDRGTYGIERGTDGIDRSADGIDRGIDGIDRGTECIDSATDCIDRGTLGIDRGTDGIDSATDDIDRGTDGIDRGTDGINRGADIPETTSLGNWPRSTHHDKKSNRFQASDSSVNNSNKLIHAKPYWESFEDDFEVERLLVGNKSISGEAFISNKHRDTNYLPPITSECPSHETSNTTVVSHDNDTLNQKFTDAEVGVSRWPNIDDFNSVKKSAHSQIDTSRSECNPIAAFDSNIPLSSNLSTSKQTNQETFADNFSINNISVNRQAQEIAHKVSNPQIISSVPHHSHWENQCKQNIQARPDIPPRKARRRAQRNPKLIRPPSPFLSSNRPDSQSMACQNENGSLYNDANNTQAIADNERNNRDDNYYLSQSLSKDKNKSSDSVSVASTLGSLQQRSYSLNEDTGTKMARPRRAVTLETDQPSAHFTDFNDWSNLFSKAQSRFLTSASNTVLQHSQDILNDSIDLSDPEMEQYFGSTVV